MALGSMETIVGQGNIDMASTDRDVLRIPDGKA